MLVVFLPGAFYEAMPQLADNRQWDGYCLNTQQQFGDPGMATL